MTKSNTAPADMRMAITMDRFADMLAYDELPASIRHEIRESNTAFSASEVEQLILEYGVAVTRQHIRATDHALTGRRISDVVALLPPGRKSRNVDTGRRTPRWL